MGGLDAKNDAVIGRPPASLEAAPRASRRWRRVHTPQRGNSVQKNESKTKTRASKFNSIPIDTPRTSFKVYGSRMKSRRTTDGSLRRAIVTPQNLFKVYWTLSDAL